MNWSTRRDKLTLSGENVSRLVWKIDVAFAVHPDMKNHSGGTMKFMEGETAMQSVLSTQKLMTNGSTTSELVNFETSDLTSHTAWCLS